MKYNIDCGAMTDDITQVSVVIPNYNGAELLRENLPSILAAFDHWGGDYEVIVVDDGSIDDSRELIAGRFPAVRLLVNDRNLGFSRSCNRGMASARFPVAFCINTDVRVNIDLVSPVVRHFQDNSIFAVTPNILAEREGKNQGIVTGAYGRGFIKGVFSPIDETSGARENLYAIGACVAYSMEKFHSLGGYSEIFTPYLFEDVDISYRAWKRGWKSIYEPGTTVYHYSSATIGKTGRRRKRTIYFRNRFLFHWINLTDPQFVCLNILHTLLRLAISFLWLDLTYYAAFWGALTRVAEVVRMRREAAPHNRLLDKDILQRATIRDN
jgi:GT2 family glycosyltransferase